MVTSTNGTTRLKLTMRVNITCDHYIIHDAHEVEFLKDLKEVVEVLAVLLKKCVRLSQCSCPGVKRLRCGSTWRASYQAHRAGDQAGGG